MDSIRRRNGRAFPRVFQDDGHGAMAFAFVAFPFRPHPIDEREGNKGKETLMAMSMTAILLHSHAVPSDVRDALHAAELAPAENRALARKQVARLLVQQATLDCRDARELVDLSPGAC
jgi:hypothetical protein